MATSVTYNTLVQDVQAYLERGASSTTDATVTAQIPRLINAAERKLAQILKLLGQIEVLSDVTGLTPGNPVIPKPDRWRQTVSMNYGASSDSNFRTPLFPRSYEYCRTYWPDDSLTSPPKFYADYGYTSWLIVPTPDVTYPLEITCYMQPPLLDANNQSNFWTIYCPNALLYGTLVEAMPFLKNDERIPVWENMYKAEIATLSGQDLQRQMDRASERRTV